MFGIGIGWIIGDTWLVSSTNGLLAIFSGTSGWIVEILISPAMVEAQHFGRIGGAILSFVSGYGVARLNDLLGSAFTDGEIPEDLFICRVLIALTSFCVGSVFVFIARRYWEVDGPDFLDRLHQITAEIPRPYHERHGYHFRGSS